MPSPEVLKLILTVETVQTDCDFCKMVSCNAFLGFSACGKLEAHLQDHQKCAQTTQQDLLRSPPKFRRETSTSSSFPHSIKPRLSLPRDGFGRRYFIANRVTLQKTENSFIKFCEILVQFFKFSNVSSLPRCLPHILSLVAQLCPHFFLPSSRGATS